MVITAQPHKELKRQLGLRAATALVIGEVIAVGIFLTPAGMAKSLGSPMLLLIVWMVMGLMALCGALCYGELAARFPEAGGGYVYLREAYGQKLAFLYGWKCFLVMDPGITAALAVGLSGYIGYLVALPPFGIKSFVVGIICAIAVVNIYGLRLGSRLMQFITAVKLGSLALIVLWAVFSRPGSMSHFMPFVAQRTGSEPLVAALAGALVAGFFSFGGWWDLSKLGGEVRDPVQTLPRAMAIGVLAVTAVYILTSAVFLYLVPLESVTSGETFAAQAGEALFGAAGGWVFSLIVIVSILGSLAGFMMAAPRVYYAMASDGVFFGFVSSVHPRFGTPVRAIVLQAVMALFLVTLGTFENIIAYFIFVTVLFIGLTVAAVFILRRRHGELSQYRIAGYPVTPLFFLIMVTILLVLLGANSTRQAVLGLGVVALGVPVYHLFFQRHSRTED
jgi:basic amino acid/polyamine antiporter, APA family